MSITLAQYGGMSAVVAWLDRVHELAPNAAQPRSG